MSDLAAPYMLPAELVGQGVIGFFLESRLFGIPIRLVREINQHLDVTPVRMASPFVRGLINLRGQVVTVLDLGAKFSFGRRTIGEKSRLIILKTNAELAELRSYTRTCDECVALLVDRISDVLQPDPADLERPPPNLDDAGTAHIAWVYKIPRSAMSVLAPATFLTHEDELTVPCDATD